MPRPARTRAWRGVALFGGAVTAVTAIGGAVTRPAIAEWYAALVKPSWTPPDWLFGPVWTALYVLMAVAAVRIWLKNDGGKIRAATIAWFAQLALNLAWSIIFFGARAPLAAMVDIVALLLAIALTIALFGRIDRPAAWLLVPYLVWVCYAASLNIGIVMSN